MPRSIAEIEGGALEAATRARKSQSVAQPLQITREEAMLFVQQHSMNRVRQGRIAPDHKYVMKKLTDGKVKLHGVPLEVK